MELAYVAGPYRAETIHDTTENIRRAREVALKLWKLGYAVICPHSNTALMDGACPDHVWLEGDLEILKRCDIVVLVDDWEKSSGTRREVEVAKELNIPIFTEVWVTKWKADSW